MLASIYLSWGDLVVEGDNGRENLIEVGESATSLNPRVNGESKWYHKSTINRIVIRGGDGNDKILLANDLKKPTQIKALAGNDTVSGGGGNDEIWGGDGDDILSGENGNDTLYGEAGSDKLNGGGGTNKLVDGEGGNDSGDSTSDPEPSQPTQDDSTSGGDYSGSSRPDKTGYWVSNGTLYVVGNEWSENEVWFGNFGNDYRLNYNGQSKNFSKGSISKIKLYGGEKNDRLSVNHDVPIAVETYAFGGDDFLLGGNKGDTLEGGNGNDSIFGADGNDKTYGSSGNDKIYAGGDNDTLDGGSGSDDLNGESGTDTGTNGESYNSVENQDGSSNPTPAPAPTPEPEPKPEPKPEPEPGTGAHDTSEHLDAPEHLDASTG